MHLVGSAFPVALIAFLPLLPSAAGEPLTRLSEWRHYRALQFNTSASGANVPGDVRNFPVAVSLNRANFSFTEAKADGSDIRFSAEANGDLLPHGIEHWDGAGQTALLWVKVPVVRGNSTAQNIYMHWGNMAATDAGDSTAVFNPKEGFVGVWHLAEEGNVEEGGYRDATATGAHGTGVNLKPGARVEACVGKGISLRHSETQWIKVAGDTRKHFDLTNQLTFSIWAKAHSYANKGDQQKRALPGYETMFAKGDNSWRLQKFGLRSWHQPAAELIEICVEKPPKADLCVVGKADMVTNQWFHLVGVHDHPKVKLYVNGVLDKEETFDVPWISGDHAVGIGNQSQFPDKGRSWDGVLDEARVLGVVKDEHWIKLDYESQREGQRFLAFGSPERRAETAVAPLPGKGLAHHDFLYSGEWDTRKSNQTMFLIQGGKVAWTYQIPRKDELNGQESEFSDMHRLSNGDIVFAYKTGWRKIDQAGKTIYDYRCPRGTNGWTECHSAQPIGMEKVLFMQNGTPARLLLYNIKTATTEMEHVMRTREPIDQKSVHGQFRNVRMTKAGTYLIAHMNLGKVIEYDKDWREIWSCDAPSVWHAARLKNSNTLTSGNQHGFVREVNPKGEIVWEVRKGDLPGIQINGVHQATRLANGNTVFCNWTAGVKKPDWPSIVQVVEVTPDKKVVWAFREWENPDLGPASCIQLLDEPGKAEEGDLQR